MLKEVGNVVLRFTAAQAAQKAWAKALDGQDLFTAAQAAQKSKSRKYPGPSQFTAAQAAQKWQNSPAIAQ